MTKIDIFSGFLGAGKTTLIKKLIKEAYAGEKLVLIENEFGEIGVDGGFMKDAGIEVTEMNSGCICCSLVGDFGEALKKVIDQFAPDRILIEPSGVGKLSDVIRAVLNAEGDGAVVNGAVTVVDATKCRMYMKNFGEFFNNQIESAGTIILSRTDGISQEKLDQCITMIREHNGDAIIVTTPWDELDGKQILAAMERDDSLDTPLKSLEEAEEHHHHDDDDEDDCCCGHDHHHEHDHEHEHEHEHHHHDHDHDEECGCGHDHHHHHHDECSCGCGHDHDHDHHHHHHADEVFTSWGVETAKKFTKDEVENALEELDSAIEYGIVLRAKGIVAGQDGQWIHFDYVPGETNVRYGTAEVTGRICVIGSQLKEDALKELFLK